MKKLLLGLILLSSVNFVGAFEPMKKQCSYDSCTINADCPGFACENGCCTGYHITIECFDCMAKNTFSPSSCSAQCKLN
jgi:hypothetical protein